MPYPGYATITTDLTLLSQDKEIRLFGIALRQSQMLYRNKQSISILSLKKGNGKDFDTDLNFSV